MSGGALCGRCEISRQDFRDLKRHMVSPLWVLHTPHLFGTMYFGTV